MKASHNKVSSQTMPRLSTFGIVLPKNHPPSRTSTLPPHSPPVEKPLTHLTETSGFLSQKTGSFCPQGECSGRSWIKQWLAWISGCTIIFWWVVKLRFSEEPQVPWLLKASRCQSLMFYLRIPALKKKTKQKQNLLKQTKRCRTKEAEYSWVYLNWT